MTVLTKILESRGWEFFDYGEVRGYRRWIDEEPHIWAFAAPDEDLTQEQSVAVAAAWETRFRSEPHSPRYFFSHERFRELPAR